MRKDTTFFLNRQKKEGNYAISLLNISKIEYYCSCFPRVLYLTPLRIMKN